jgi:hypothetical protein
MFGQAAQVVLGLHGDNFGDGVGVVAEVHAVAGADLDDPPGQSCQCPVPLRRGAALLGLLADPLVHAGEPRVLERGKICHRCAFSLVSDHYGPMG